MDRLFFEEILMVPMARANLCLFWKVESVIYGQGLFFEENSMLIIARANLCLFWNVGSVTYRQRPLLRRYQ